jgi:hypothetical protein
MRVRVNEAHKLAILRTIPLINPKRTSMGVKMSEFGFGAQ